MGRRFIIVEGVERWSDADVEGRAGARAGRDAARDDGRVLRRARRAARRRPKALHAAVAAAGGDIVGRAGAEGQGPPALGRWSRRRGSGIALDGVGRPRARRAGRRPPAAAAARAREARARARPGRVDRRRRGRRPPRSPRPSAQVWGLVDAVVARDRRAALSAYAALRAQGEDAGRLVPLIARRLREVAGIAAAARGRAPRPPT